MKKRRGQAGRGLSRKSRTVARAGVERFEDRLLMAIFTVLNTQDNPTTGSANDGTLRGEIMASNAAPATTGVNVIDFAFTTPGVQTINLAASLPALTAPVLIDGSTSNGFTNKPLVQINGGAAGGIGLNVQGAGSEIRDLIIDNFSGDGIDLAGGRGLVDGCYIGTNAAGSAVLGNLGQGIFITSGNNTVGGLTSGPNVISGNGMGVQIRGNLAIGNTITHNYVGTDATGLVRLGNTFFGIEDDQAGNTIGGVATSGPAGLGNLVSGNTTGGINLSNQATNTVVEGNYVGTDKTGLAPIPNGSVGVYLNSVQNDTIGGLVAGAGNVISSNRGYGVEVTGATSTFIQIEGNFIGVGANGATALGNDGTGVFILGSSGVTVGGSTFFGNSPQYGNVIAYNGVKLNQYGVEVRNGSMDGILSNSIYANGNQGIKLTQGNAGVAPPTLISAQSGAGQTRIAGTYFGSPNTSYRIQFFSNQVPNPSGAGDGQTYLLGDLDFTTNNVGQFAFTTLLQSGVPVGAFLSATATQDVLVVNNTSQFATNVQVTKAAITDLGVTATLPTVGPLLDQAYTYTLDVTNAGPDDASGVVLTDKLPANSTFIGASGGTFSGGVLTDDIGALAANGTDTVTITVLPISTGKFINTATVTGNELDNNPSNNTITTTGIVAPDADLSVNLTPSGSPVPVGSPITYTLVVANNGPSAATGTVVTVQFPSSFASIVVMPDQGSYTVDTNNLVTINTGILPGNSSSTIVIMATPTNVGVLDTTATVTSPVEDPNPGNNTTTVPVSVANAADLGVTIAAPATVLAGQDLFYTITVTNNGPSAASSPVVTDPLPANVTFDPANSSAGGSGSLSIDANGVVTANLFALVPLGIDFITIAVIPNSSGQVVNAVTVGDPTIDNPVEIDPDLSNNTASATTLVSPVDLQVTIDQPSSSADLFLNNVAMYQVTVTNVGPATATNVLLNDTFGPGATIVNTSVGPASGSSVNLNLGSLASGASTSVFIAVDPTVAGYTGNLVDSATVSSDEIELNPNDNTTSSSNLVSPVDVGVLAASSPANVLVGQPVGYVVAVTNYGPATATNVKFADTLPAGVTFDSVTTTQGAVSLSTPTTLAGNLLDIAPGSTVTVTILVTPNAVESAINTATATPFEIDTNPANNTASASSSVFNVPGAIQLGSALAVVPENAGSVTLTVERLGGTLGAVSVNYATSDLSAVAGVNYVATSGVLTFAQGQTAATITIPVIDDGVVNGDHQFLLTLSNPTNGASIGSPSVATVDVTNTDRDTVPPQVSSLIATTQRGAITSFTITFDKAMDPTRASLLVNYQLFLTNGGTSQKPIGLVQAIYNPSTDSVTLVPGAPLPNNRFYRVIANGTIGPVLTDISGNILSGSSGPNSNYDVTYGQGTKLAYTDSQNNSVTLNLAGGGILQVYRAANGDASTVNLFGVVPHKSKLTGGVKKLKKSASGHTNIGSITGLGQFGTVFSSLTTPSFYVGYAPVTTSSVAAPHLVSVASIPTPHVTVTKKTPKGPKPSHR